VLLEMLIMLVVQLVAVVVVVMIVRFLLRGVKMSRNQLRIIVFTVTVMTLVLLNVVYEGLV
jgi:hypothetical protein